MDNLKEIARFGEVRKFLDPLRIAAYADRDAGAWSILLRVDERLAKQQKVLAAETLKDEVAA